MTSLFSVRSFVILLISFFISISSILRYPFQDLFTAPLVLIFSSGILCLFFMFFLIKKELMKDTIIISLILFFVFFIKTIYGFFVANFKIEQDLFGVLLEARFGFFTFLAPILYFFLQSIDKKNFSDLLVSTIFFIFLIDISYIIFFLDGSIFSGRPEEWQLRFHLDILCLAFLILIYIDRFNSDNSFKFISICLFLLFLHSVLISTARMNSLFILGIFIYLINQKNKKLSIIFQLGFISCTFLFAIYIVSQNLFEFQGRNWLEYLKIISNNIFLGVGIVRDISLNSYSTSSFIFQSDYGLLIFIYRYGLIGIILMILFLLLVFHIVVTLPGNKQNSNIFLFLLLVSQFLLVPFFEYLYLQSIFLFSFLWHRRELFKS